MPLFSARARRVLILALFSAMACTCASPAPPPNAAKTFLIASDLHFNPMADAKLVDELNDAPPTQWESILDRSSSQAFSQYGEDTNWWLLQSALDAMRTTLPHPAFMLVTGDLLAHQFPATYGKLAKNNSPESYRKFVLHTIEFLALELRKRFPHTRILLTPGNNDDNCGNYAIAANGLFLHDTAELVRKLAQADEQLTSSWESLGSYDIAHPALPDMRIISLNSVFFSNKYQAQKSSKGCAVFPSTAPEDLYAWLEARLKRAQQADEKVWLMFHIPPGMDGYSSLFQYQALLKNGKTPAAACPAALVPMWVPKWTAQFDALLAKYHDTVVVSLAGHTHTDEFRVIRAAGAGDNFVLISSAISPVYDQNPAFRVASFNRNGALLDSSVYYLTNLLFASSTTAGEWKREYTFSQEWKLQGVNAETLATVYDRITSTEADRAEWLRLYNVSSSAARLPAYGAVPLYCAVEALDPESYENCFCRAIDPEAK